MEMNMVAAGDLSLPSNVTELRVPIHFKDALKVEGLKVSSRSAAVSFMLESARFVAHQYLGISNDDVQQGQRLRPVVDGTGVQRHAP